ncbi:MAG: glycoside hydrolase family 5 protein [Bacteriovoracaceae bacterium]
MKKYILILLSIFFISSCATKKLSNEATKPLGHGANVVPTLSDSDLLELIKDWKVEVVRILDNSVLLESAPYDIDQKKLDNFFHLADLSLKNGATVVIAPGAFFDNHQAFFTSIEKKLALVKWWIAVASHYKGHQGRVIFDLFNEPHDEAAIKEWPKLAQELIYAIRTIDPYHEIMIEPPEWGWPKGFAYFNALEGNRLIYSFHYYGPMDFTHLRGYNKLGQFIGHLKATEKERLKRRYPGFIQGETWNSEKLKRELAPAFQFQSHFKVPVWCGEFGTVRWSVGAYDWLEDMMDVMKDYGFGWAYYSFREWQAMDLEMNQNVVNKATLRQETSLSSLIKKRMKD